MARMIDAVQVLHNINMHHRPTPVSEFESGFNDGLNQAMWEITHAPTLTQPNEPLTVTEVCPHCESEITMEWDVKTRGHKAVCPVCGNRLMLCDECQHGEPGHRCDYDSDTDTCRFNRRPPEGEEET